MKEWDHQTSQDSVKFWGILPSSPWILLFGGVCVCSVHIFTVSWGWPPGQETHLQLLIFEVAPYWLCLVGSSSWCLNMGHLPRVLTGMPGKKWTVGKIGGSRLTCFISLPPGKKPFLSVSWHLPSTPTDFSCDLIVIQLRGHSFDFGLH